jgi:hypothetical protein
MHVSLLLDGVAFGYAVYLFQFANGRLSNNLFWGEITRNLLVRDVMPHLLDPAMGLWEWISVPKAPCCYLQWFSESKSAANSGFNRQR